jgi:hypothetical protein
MKRVIVIGLFACLLSGCDQLKKEFESKDQNPGIVMKEVTPKWEAAVVMCQNVEVTQTKERTETKVKFEGFRHIERSVQMGERNISHCIPCEKATSEREKKVCYGDGKQ